MSAMTYEDAMLETELRHRRDAPYRDAAHALGWEYSTTFQGWIDTEGPRFGCSPNNYLSYDVEPSALAVLRRCGVAP